MELNKLPDGYDDSKLGPQKRRTEFASEAEKVAYDADNLITKARASLQATGVEIASREQILMATQIIVGSHRKDYNEALAGAINAKLDIEEQETRLEQARSREASRFGYEAFIDDLKLSETDTAKLKEMMSEANYVSAVETAKEMKASRIPTYGQIVAELTTFTPERLRDICEMMEKPKLQIVSDQSFDENIAAMNANKHYTSASGRPQEGAHVYRGSDSPYNRLSRPSKGKVSIVDGVVHPKQLTGVSTKLGARRTHLTQTYTDKGMRNVDKDEMATLLQQSLREAKAANDNSLIVDNWESGTGTVTILDPDSLTESTLVACASFNSHDRRADFDAYDPEGEVAGARGRASVQVMEF